MEKLSPKCQLICICVVASLLAAIIAAPAGPGMPAATDPIQATASRAKEPGLEPGARLQARGSQPVLNCAGGDSVNCHRVGNQAGL